MKFSGQYLKISLLFLGQSQLERSPIYIQFKKAEFLNPLLFLLRLLIWTFDARF